MRSEEALPAVSYCLGSPRPLTHQRISLSDLCLARRFAAVVKLSPAIKNKKMEAVLPIIKIHLEYAEYDAVERFASSLKVKTEAVAYCALNRLMLRSEERRVGKECRSRWSPY